MFWRRQGRARTIGVLVGTTLAVGAVGLVLFLGRLGAGGGTHAFPEISLPPFPQRCGQGDSPQEAPSVADAKLASASTMTYSVWCGAGLVEGFSSGVRISMEPNGYPDPTSAFRQMAKQDGVGAFVAKVQGVPALEEDALNSDEPGRYGSVFFVIDDLYVRVWGDGSNALPDLLAVAESITPSLPARLAPTPSPSSIGTISTNPTGTTDPTGPSSSTAASG
jgi:hypothetical protein